jgi:pSer/pThr/pTyr-binding forkhead associated (FHA) protein
MVIFRRRKESAASDRVIQLAIIQGDSAANDQTGKTFDLHSGDNIIGRDLLCEVVLHSGTVSRKHANLRVSYDKNKFTLYDLGSANGVFIPPSTVLRNKNKAIESGDEFQVGEIRLKLVVSMSGENFQTMNMDFLRLMQEKQKE